MNGYEGACVYHDQSTFLGPNFRLWVLDLHVYTLVRCRPYAYLDTSEVRMGYQLHWAQAQSFTE